MIGIELVKDKETKKPAVEETTKLREEARKRGILVGTGGVKRCTVRIQPPLVITREQVDKALSALDESLSVIESGL